MNNLISIARFIPKADATPAMSFSCATLTAPNRGLPLQLRVTAPAVGTALPIIIFSHGHGPSLYIPSKDGYAPLVNFYAEHGFVVIQPTHLNSKVAGLNAGAPGGPLFWRSRVEDIALILDLLDEIEAQVTFLAGRLDHSRIAAVGHSLGGQTVGMLLGARLTDPRDPTARDVNLIERRIKAGVLLAAPGNGGDSLSSWAAENYSALNPDYSYMTTPTLVVAGDNDSSAHLTIRGAGWHADAYHHSPGSKYLLTLFGAKHGLGGIAGYDCAETDDENPDRLAVVQRMTWAYLRSALYDKDPAWSLACEALYKDASSLGGVECK
ncbi:chlorophyllase [Pseudomonas sp. D4002]|uniref:alpha/beta hydrolase family protein n=1 Tax=Pseudomonas sp. D4002 TaxID=2738817 RepID=UPI0015A10C9F|nr:alpha/beta fold hydrolase [Pseudomonas sp. D4002]NWB24305.1 chlorophyllase [Pseudomonas sp. D4002]